MFKYTKEVIINSPNMEDGSTRISLSNGVVTIKRAGEYEVSKISGKVWKTEPVVGSPASVTINGAIAFASTGIYRVVVTLKSLRKFTADMANANWSEFGKQIVVEIDVTATGTTAANTAAKALAYAFGEIATVSASSSNVVITLKDAYISVASAQVAKYNSASDEYTAVAGDVATVTDNTEPFGTGEWIQENLRFPSYPNVRYSALYADEYPVMGGEYTQYSFAYESERPGLGGLSAVGQKIESVTQHIFYVAEGAVSAFETAFTGLIDVSSAYPEGTPSSSLEGEEEEEE